MLEPPDAMHDVKRVDILFFLVPIIKVICVQACLYLKIYYYSQQI